jgi:hypothetical protein
MTTAWTNPTQIFQYSEPGAELIHKSWNFSDSDYMYQLISLNGVLEHIARSPKYDITNKTYYFKATGYRFTNLPEVISGIELRLSADRVGRISDDTIQLCLNDELIGKNTASTLVNPVKIYGGETDLWDTEISIPDVMNMSFGIVIRLKSHPHWPHKDTALIRAMELRIH